MHEFKFFNLRQHLYTRKKTPRKGLNSQEIYRRKDNARIERRKLAQSGEGIAFYKWIDMIQEKLGLTNEEFAKELGIKPNSLYRIREKYGNFPSHSTFNRLLELENLSRIKVEIN